MSSTLRKPLTRPNHRFRPTLLIETGSARIVSTNFGVDTWTQRHSQARRAGGGRGGIVPNSRRRLLRRACSLACRSLRSRKPTGSMPIFCARGARHTANRTDRQTCRRITAQCRSNAGAGHRANDVRHSDRNPTPILRFKVFEAVQPLPPPGDDKTLNVRVDEVLAARRWSEKSRPATNHPWCRNPEPPPGKQYTTPTGHFYFALTSCRRAPPATGPEAPSNGALPGGCHERQ